MDIICHVENKATKVRVIKGKENIEIESLKSTKS